MTMSWTMALALTAIQVATPEAVPEPAAPAPAAAPANGQVSKQAVELGERLARAGALTSIAPMLAEKDIADVIKAHPDWTSSDISIYRTSSRRVATADLNKLVRALGLAYAERLSMEDLTALVKAVETPRALRRRTIEGPALSEALQAVGAIDFKRDTLAAFCLEMGKGCSPK